MAHNSYEECFLKVKFSVSYKTADLSSESPHSQTNLHSFEISFYQPFKPSQIVARSDW